MNVPTRSAIPVLVFGALALVGAIVLIGLGHGGAQVDTLFGIAGAALTGGAGLTVGSHTVPEPVVVTPVPAPVPAPVSDVSPSTVAIVPVEPLATGTVVGQP